MIISRIGLLLAIAILLEFGGSSARAELIVGDLINPGDHSLVTDTATGLQWLSPVYTAGNSFDDSFVQNLITDDRFAYASEAQVEAMINANFDSPPVGSPGTAAGFADAAAFFDVFGVA